MKNIFKIASLLSAAVMLFSCEGTIDNGDNGGDGNELTVSVDKSFIQSNGTDVATIEVKFRNQVVTEGVTFYSGLDLVTVDDFKFTATEDGVYTMKAAYKTYQSDEFTITAIPVPVPASVEDPQPSNTNFVKKVHVTKFTGTGCGFCPQMNQAFRLAEENHGINDLMVLASAHTYNADDPAAISAPLDDAMGVTGHPFVVFDMAVGFNNYNAPDALAQCIKDQYAKPAMAGISVNSVYADETVVVKATVKAAEAGTYRIGAWLLEDAIYGAQISAMVPEDNYHDNCIRIVDSKASVTNYSGYRLGNLEAGQTVDYVFYMPLKSDWKAENMHLNVFVTVADQTGYYSTTNVIDCPIEGQTPFAYAE